MALIGRKQQAANLLYGDTGAGGLSELTGASGGSGDLLAELAKAIDQDESVTDLRDLFARHATRANPSDSTWLVNEPTPEPEPVMVTENQDELIQVAVEEEPRPTLDLVGPPPRQKRCRRRVDLADAPEDDEPPIEVPGWPVHTPEPVPVRGKPEVRQLALF